MNFDLLAKANGQRYLAVFRPIGLIQMTLNRAAWRVHEKNVVATWEPHQQLLKDTGRPTKPASRWPDAIPPYTDI